MSQRLPQILKAATTTALLGIIATATACAHSTIAGTNIPDTPVHRAVAAVLEEFREALETRSAERILTLVSPTYFEDMGNSDPSDDYGYHELEAGVLATSMQVAKEVFVGMQVHDIVVDVDSKQAHVDIRYKSRARLELPSGKTLWDSQRDFSRVILELNDNGRWLIVSGL